MKFIWNNDLRIGHETEGYFSLPWSHALKVLFPDVIIFTHSAPNVSLEEFRNRMENALNYFRTEHSRALIIYREMISGKREFYLQE